MTTPKSGGVSGSGRFVYNSTIKCRTPLRQRQKPIARNTPPKPESDKRKADNVTYRLRRTAFLKEHSICQAVVDGVPCHAPSADIHHKYSGKDRDAHFLDEDTWVAICRPHHDWVGAHPKEARAQGLLF